MGGRAVALVLHRAVEGRGVARDGTDAHRRGGGSGWARGGGTGRGPGGLRGMPPFILFKPSTGSLPGVMWRVREEDE